MSEQDKCPDCGWHPFVNGHHVEYIGPAGAKRMYGPIGGKFCLRRQVAALNQESLDAYEAFGKATREKDAEIEQLQADCAALREAVIDVDTYHDLYADKACYEGSSADWDKLAPFKAKAETAYKLAIGNNSGQPLLNEVDWLRNSNMRLAEACERALRYEVDCVASNGADYDEKAAREDFAFIRDARDAAKEAANG